MSQQHNPATLRLVLIPMDTRKYDRAITDNGLHVLSPSGTEPPSDEGTETETISGDGTIADPHSCVRDDGRTYQGYMPGGEDTKPYSIYSAPEQLHLTYTGRIHAPERSYFSHALYRLMLDDGLAAAPLREPEHVLDIGTGTGLWALQFAEENPTCQVIGTDLSLIQPLSWMPNFQFVMENSELQEWLFPHKFDYIHLRGMTTCFNEVKTVMQKALHGLASGGWIEFQEGCFKPHGVPGDEALKGTALGCWCRLVVDGVAKCGRDLSKARLFKQQLAETGFVDVHEKVIHVPGGPWPDDSKRKLLGIYFANTMIMGAINSFKKLLAASRKLSSQEMDELSEKVKEDVRNPEIRCYMPM